MLKEIHEELAREPSELTSVPMLPVAMEVHEKVIEDLKNLIDCHANAAITSLHFVGN